MNRIARGLAIALALAQASGNLRAHELLMAQAQQVEGPAEDACNDLEDWILTLFRGLDAADCSGGQGPRGNGSGGDDGGDDGGLNGGAGAGSGGGSSGGDDDDDGGGGDDDDDGGDDGDDDGGDDDD